MLQRERIEIMTSNEEKRLKKLKTQYFRTGIFNTSSSDVEFLLDIITEATEQIDALIEELERKNS